MEINKNKTGETLTVSLSGRLDTNTAPKLQDSIAGSAKEVKAIDIDLCELEYISSAGLRVLLFLHKECTQEGAVLSILNCNDMTKDVFKMTGFDKILNIR